MLPQQNDSDLLSPFPWHLDFYAPAQAVPRIKHVKIFQYVTTHAFMQIKQLQWSIVNGRYSKRNVLNRAFLQFYNTPNYKESGKIHFTAKQVQFAGRSAAT